MDQKKKYISYIDVMVLPRQREHGVALVMVLLFLVLLTGISVWGVRKSVLSEGMARNQLDLEVAREAAESALRDAERDIFYPTVSTAQNASCARGVDELTKNSFTTACDLGLCYMDDSNYPAVNWSTATSSSTTKEVWWPENKGGLWNNTFTDKPDRSSASADTGHCAFKGGVPMGTFTGAQALAGVIRQPEYMIEYFYRKNVRMNLPESQVSSTGLSANKVSSMYRITARGFGYSENSQVLLQTIIFP